MKIAICTSMVFTEQMLAIKKKLEAVGHTVFVSCFSAEYVGKTEQEKEQLTLFHKNHKDAIREFYERIKESDAILVLNYDRRGVQNYIGGNTLMEIGFAHVLNKKIFFMNPIPTIPYYQSELEAVKPTILYGDFSPLLVSPSFIPSPKLPENGIVQQTADYVKQKLSGEGSGHDWWHVHRVWKTALHIGNEENRGKEDNCGKEHVDLLVIQLAALLHDIADWKFHGGDDAVGPRLAREWLEQNNAEERVISHVCQIIKDMSFKGAGVASPMKTFEGKVVQDADRLDAIGAIGIARAFAYSGNKGRMIYDPTVQPEQHVSFEQYKSNKSSAINHFYEKLLLMRGLMNTATAKAIAENRHQFMEEFLEQFLEEWGGKV